MKIELHKIKISEVVKDYKDSAEEGVSAFGGKLDIRPKYQREFVYSGKQRDEVIRTVKNGFPLNVMYWVKKEDGNFEVLDGQQRTISIAQFVNGDFSIEFNGRTAMFHNLTPEEKEQIMNYDLMIYHCEGKDKEKLDWFKIINIAGERLTDQELRNAVYTGPWLSDAKLKFSKTNCAAYLLANDGGSLVSGSLIRQEYLETALSWISNEQIEEYMAKNQHDKNANELWQYFQDVIHWVRKTFPNYRKEMAGVNWGELYNEERYLSIRAFTPNMKREAYERQDGVCPVCKKEFAIGEMEADHIKPWHEGGRTVAENCQMLCKEDNRTKSGK
ncbi:MAG: HNH endonuclease domain protein [Candidatus Nomurabacteria bacterium GW2011_GWA2_40_9]|uniref:HNH endonuclease domain protein n=1 Tax=Candidatus Nomurabacteria bacterium GW2011_GWA2_40_9 TaxID=1618734 RepID=A0A0G0TVM7_9BACT|nr:MAG: HNH endonuclease domain protein [Candidatus Nomurabacteria bacterium GW2011_GWA2_40_9]